MTHLPQHIALLIYRTSVGIATPVEKNELEDWAAADAANRVFLEQMANGETMGDWLQQQKLDEQSGLQQQLLNRIMTEIGHTIHVKEETVMGQSVHFSFWRNNWLGYAAVLLLLLIGVFFLLPKNKTLPDAAAPAAAIVQKSVLPGGNRASLTLADGSTISLDSAANGQLVSQGNTSISKPGDGRLAYIGKAQPGKLLYNTITTPKGGTYQLVLSDGTKVWLNASSSVRFPVSFDKERVISVTGEVYMEVAASAQRPFLVQVNQSLVTVLGTSFNINAYGDEPGWKATLVSGKIQLTNSGHKKLLLPGQVATIAEEGTIQTRSADTQKAIAWKNGWFQFEDAGIEQIMNQLIRWYDIEVRYQGTIPVRRYSGAIARDLPLQEVLEMLQKSNLRFNVNNSVITVLP